MSTYALVTDGIIDHPYRVPSVLRTDDRDYDLRSLDPDLLAVHGIYEVVQVARPADTDTTTHDRTVELVDGVPTVVWTQRAKTQAELDAEAEAAAAAERAFVLEQAIPTLRQWADDAAATTATSTNAVNVLNVVVDRLGVFFDRFADLLENRYR